MLGCIRFDFFFVSMLHKRVHCRQNFINTVLVTYVIDVVESIFDDDADLSLG